MKSLVDKVGRGSVGHAIIADSASDLEGKDLSDKVIITNSVDETLVPYVENAIGLVTEEMELHHQVQSLV